MLIIDNGPNQPLVAQSHVLRHSGSDVDARPTLGLPGRVAFSRIKGWRIPPGTVVVTRATILGNPWVAGDQPRFFWPLADRAGWKHKNLPVVDECGPLSIEGVVFAFRRWVTTGLLDHLELPDWHWLGRTGRADLRADMAARRALILRRLPALRGHQLACTCKPGCPCHADVLLEMANA